MSFSLDLKAFAEKAKGNVEQVVKKVSIDLLNAVVDRSPVGNPELWAANIQHRQANTAAADAYDYNVAIRNTVINLTGSNFTKSGKLKRNVKYAKPLTKTERDQNFNVNGLVAGKGYVGGRFRGNWQFSIDTPADGELDTIDPSGNATVAALRAQVSGLTIGQTAYIVNNLPYAIPLEYGHSKQAPHGMVRVTLANFQRIVDEAIRNNRV